MSSDYTIEINTKAKAIIYREGGRVLRFELDTRAHPMVVYYHEFSDGDSSLPPKALTDEVRDKVCPRITQFLIRNRVPIKVTYTGLRTRRN